MANSQADWAHRDRTYGRQDLASAPVAEIRVRDVAKGEAALLKLKAGAAAPPEAAGLAPKPA